MAWDTDLDAASVAYGIAAAPEPRVRVIAGPGDGEVIRDEAQGG